ESLLAEWIAGRKVRDVILTGKIELPEYLRDQLPRRLEEYQLGIEVERASIARLDPPDPVKKDFERVAEAQNGIKTRINQADTAANKLRAEAKAEKIRIER